MVMRLALALIFISAGYSKLAIMGVDNFAAAMNLPVFVAWLVALGELGAGIGIVAGKFLGNADPKGMLTRLSGLTLVIIMLGAIFLTKLSGFEAGFLEGLKGSYTDLALLALGLNFAMVGNTGTKCDSCSR